MPFFRGNTPEPFILRSEPFWTFQKLYMGCYVSSYMSSYVGFSCLFRGNTPEPFILRSEPFWTVQKLLHGLLREFLREFLRRFFMPFFRGIPLKPFILRSEPFWTVQGGGKNSKNHVRNHVRNQAKKTILGRGWTVRFSPSVSRAKPVATDHVRLAIAITRLTVTHFHEPHHHMGLWVNINWQYNATYIQYKDCFKGPLFTWLLTSTLT